MNITFAAVVFLTIFSVCIIRIGQFGVFSNEHIYTSICIFKKNMLMNIFIEELVKSVKFGELTLVT